MPKQSKQVAVTGTVAQVLMSPKGVVEGALIRSRGRLLQLTVEKHCEPAALAQFVVGKRVAVKACLDESAKAATAEHPVYVVARLPAVKTIKHARTRITGNVASMHYSRHGHRNGVVLRTGDFIHLKPHGMDGFKLRIGSAIDAIGVATATALGTTVLEAQRVNGKKIPA
jgi:hypothetical protein